MGSDILYEAIEDLEKHISELKSVLVKLLEFGKAAHGYIEDGVLSDPDVTVESLELWLAYKEKLEALNLEENDWEESLKLLRSL